MLDSRKDIIDWSFQRLFWAFDIHTGKRADHTGCCLSIEEKPWSIIAVDIVGCDREFSKYRFYFQVAVE